MNHIVTIMGFMGSGKSTMGKLLAKEWVYQYLDLDHEIEKKYNLAIPQIFKTYGEKGFRDLETSTLREVLNQQTNCVISLGGGTPCFNDNMDLIIKASTSIYLKISPDELSHRLLRSPNPRPLVQDKSEQELKEYILKELKFREQFYGLANHIIESDCIRLSDLIAFVERP